MTTTVSIIIPTYNRAHSLRVTLEHIGRQTYPLGAIETIVVDDGSSDTTSDVATASYPFRLRYIRQSNSGCTTARNVGARESRGDVLILLDDDILIEPGFVGGLIHEHEAHDRMVGLGMFRPYHKPGESHFRRIHADLMVTRHPSPEASFLECTSNAFSVRREHFFEIGMMQDLIGDGQALWCDLDFGYRAHRLGFIFRRNSAAVCYHDDYAIENLEVCARRAEKIARWSVALIRKYPELDGQLAMLSDMRPIICGKDKPALIIRKALRAFASTRLVHTLLEKSVRWLEAHYPHDWLLRPMYRWTLGGDVYQGYRRGLKEF